MTKEEICTGHSVGPGEIEDLKKQLTGEEDLRDLSTMFKALSDPTRLNIIHLLSKSPLCVCDISTILNMSQSSISHHLRTLRGARLVKFKRDGKLAIYSLDDDHVFKVYKQGLDHIRHK